MSEGKTDRIWVLKAPVTDGVTREDHLKPTMQMCFDPRLEIHKEGGPKGAHAEVSFKKQ